MVKKAIGALGVMQDRARENRDVSTKSDDHTCWSTIVGGRSAPNGFIYRTLLQFPRRSESYDARGFVQNSFYSGLRTTEFFFHTMAAGEGLLDTAVKTDETGYMSHRLIKALDDLSVQHENAVRSASGFIVQLICGDDGMDSSRMEGKNFSTELLQGISSVGRALMEDKNDSEVYRVMGLWSLLEGCLLLANALAILNEDRFLAPRGWSFQEFSGVKRNSFKGQLIGLIYATQYLRVLLILLNSICIVVKLVSG
ncbi:hypothetical protein RJ639_035069 [Escallonia herrerae]|uniref:DNA-directed RNA polymerase n=1 Tax=Escallonia herrerae TaxID=1293975 RepID=A0AA88WP46_9ASTE|nr:hypothetical protein RJ639_035069 [Escallonia herrerae]